jgi:hypothetical protein
MAGLIRWAKAINNKWCFLSLILRVNTIGHAIKAVKNGEEVDLERWFVKPDRREQAEDYSTGQAEKRESHGASLKENEHEQS